MSEATDAEMLEWLDEQIGHLEEMQAVGVRCLELPLIADDVPILRSVAARLRELTVAVRPSTGKAEPQPGWSGEGEA